MNDSDLDSKLKTVRVPEREQDFWEMFPARVLAKSRATPVARVQRLWLPRLAWGGGIAFACLVIGTCFGSGLGCPWKTVSYALQSAKSFHSDLEQLPERVRAIMQIDHGLHSLIEERP